MADKAAATYHPNQEATVTDDRPDLSHIATACHTFLGALGEYGATSPTGGALLALRDAVGAVTDDARLLRDQEVRVRIMSVLLVEAGLRTQAAKRVADGMLADRVLADRLADRARVDRVREVLADPDLYEYDSRDVGKLYDANSVDDLLADLRRALGDTPPNEPRCPVCLFVGCPGCTNPDGSTPTPAPTTGDQHG